jgi:simple sugar transport system permease protein
MMFMARSLTVVVSGGFPPRLDMALIPEHLSSPICPGCPLIRASFLWFVGIAIVVGPAPWQDQLRQLGPRHGRLPAGRAGHGHPHGAGEVACFMICSMLAGFAA